MKTTIKYIYIALLSAFAFSACEKEDKLTEFPHSKPMIESVKVLSLNTSSPSIVIAGDSIELQATVSDQNTPLSTLDVKIVIANRLVSTTKLRTSGYETSVSGRFRIPFIANMEDGIVPEIFLVLENVEGDTTELKLPTESNVTINRPTLNNKLYLVSEEGTVVELTKSASDQNKYESATLDIKGNSINYKIAEKLTVDNEIDYSGFVWGYTNESVELVDITGGDITTTNSSIKTIQNIVFNVLTFESQMTGLALDPTQLALEDFTAVEIDKEAFKKIELPWSQNMEITLSGELANMDVVFNPTFFDRTAVNKIKFLGDNGTWTIYYNPVRKIVIVNRDDVSFPEVLFAYGFGLGYPTKITTADIKITYPNKDGRTTTNWDRIKENVLGQILFRRISTNIYQGVVYMPGDHDSYLDFKFFEGYNWENDKKANEYTFTGEDVIAPQSDGNWKAKAGIEHTYYRVTIDISAKTVDFQKVTLP